MLQEVWRVTSTLLLCLNSGSASFRGAFEGQVSHNAARWLLQSKGSFFSLFLEDALLLSFVASHIPGFFAHPKKKKEREKVSTSCGVDHHFHWPGRQKSCMTQPGNAPKARPSHLTTADAFNKVSPKDSPSKTAKVGSFKGCRPWIETQLLTAREPRLTGCICCKRRIFLTKQSFKDTLLFPNEMTLFSIHLSSVSLRPQQWMWRLKKNADKKKNNLWLLILLKWNKNCLLSHVQAAAGVCKRVQYLICIFKQFWKTINTQNKCLYLSGQLGNFHGDVYELRVASRWLFKPLVSDLCRRPPAVLLT